MCLKSMRVEPMSYILWYYPAAHLGVDKYMSFFTANSFNFSVKYHEEQTKGLWNYIIAFTYAKDPKNRQLRALLVCWTFFPLYHEFNK